MVKALRSVGTELYQHIYFIRDPQKVKEECPGALYELWMDVELRDNYACSSLWFSLERYETDAEIA